MKSTSFSYSQWKEQKAVSKGTIRRVQAPFDSQCRSLRLVEGSVAPRGLEIVHLLLDPYFLYYVILTTGSSRLLSYFLKTRQAWRRKPR